MNTRGSWRYIEFLWCETIGLCKKLNIIYNIINFLCNSEPQAAGKSDSSRFKPNHSMKYIF